jgi:hypothetical protein
MSKPFILQENSPKKAGILFLPEVKFRIAVQNPALLENR